ncbi:MAG: ABC transporter ATP-binding protein, partial [Planctomycetaceae bacterium]
GYVRRFFEPILRLSEQLAAIQKAFAAAERTFLLLREPVAIEDPAQPQSWPGLKRSVRFENVWFRYGEADGWVLKDVSFTLPAGEHWALVGPTGSGKTTIVNLLLRFYEPQRGRILIDGVDPRDMEQAELRRHVGLVLQDIFLFPGDLEANLTLGRPVPREQIEETARITLADRFIERLPGGFHADLAERGGNLSVGERQLLSFTRALVRDPELLILDEATSAVDPATEAMLGEATHRLLEGRTALVIAHRLSTIRDCDRILVLQHGELVEEGTHEELLSGGGLYRALHQLQFETTLAG